MPPRNVTVFNVYQLSNHRSLGFYTGDEGTVMEFCSLKYNVEQDDIAIERIPVRTITYEEVVCFKEIIGQLRTFSQKLMEMEDEGKVDIKEDLVDLLLDLEPQRA